MADWFVAHTPPPGGTHWHALREAAGPVEPTLRAEEKRMYEATFEIAGPAAMFTRPDTGATPISYPVPTWSALKGMFEAVARRYDAYIRPTHVEVCNAVQYERYVTNYGGPLRKSAQVKAGNNHQLIATILVDVRYRVFGVAEPAGERLAGINGLHALQEMFERRLTSGQSFYAPCLGWKEFVPSYFGPLLPTSYAHPEVDLVIPSLLHSVFDRPVGGRVRPEFRRNVKVNGGVLSYEEGRSDAE